MVHPNMKKQDLPLVPSQNVIGWTQIGQVLPRELGSDHIIFHLLQVGGELRWFLCQI